MPVAPARCPALPIPALPAPSSTSPPRAGASTKLGSYVKALQPTPRLGHLVKYTIERARSAETSAAERGEARERGVELGTLTLLAWEPWNNLSSSEHDV